MKRLLMLLSFMTRLPVPKVEYNEEELGKSMKLFPFVGFIIGVILIILVWPFIEFNLSVDIGIIFVILFDIIITGAIHLDGLADTFDGIFSYRSKQKMLEIMKDSRIGTNGVIALIMYFLLKFFLLKEVLTLLGLEQFILVLLSYPVISRMASVISCATSPYARATGMGKTFVENTTKKDGIFVVFKMIIFSLLLLKSGNLFNVYYAITMVFIVLFVALVAYLYSKLMERKIGGITGDTLGALLELSGLLYIFLILFIYNIALYFIFSVY